MNIQPVLLKQRGMAVIEFTLVLPLLLLLMLGAAELGHAFYQYNTLTKAVRDGTRYLSANALLGSTGVISISNLLRTNAINLVIYGKTTSSDTPLISDFTDTNAVTITTVNLDHIRVMAAYNYVPMLFPTSLPTFGIGEPISLDFTLNASVTMRAL